MYPLIFLKTLSELSFIYSFLGFFALQYKSTSLQIFLSASLQALFLTLSSCLEKKEKLRFIPIILSFGLFLIPPVNLAFFILLIPSEIYLFQTARKKAYYPSWANSAELLSLYWKIALIFTIIMLVLQKAAILSAISLPLGILCMLCCVLLTRSLRHDIDVYTSPLYQAVNASAAALLLIFTAFVSSKAFRRTIGKLFKALYLNIIMPILLFFTKAMFFIFYSLVKIINYILSLFKIKGAEVPDYETLYGKDDTSFIESDYDPNAHPILKIITTCIIILIAIYVVYRLLMRFIGNTARKRADFTGEREERHFINPKEEEKEKKTSDLCEKVRNQYKKFLKLYKKANLPMDISFTSRHIANSAKKFFDEESLEKLRLLYIKARYAKKADEKDVEKAKEIVKDLKIKT